MPTMQKPLLPIQISSASAAPARARNGQPEGGAQFKQALHREVEQRRAPAKPNGPAKEQQATKAPAAKPASEPAKAVADKAADQAAPVADDSAAQAAAVAAAGQNPVLDMMALVASFNQPTATVAPQAPEAAADPLLAATLAPVADGQFAAAAASAATDKLAAAGSALLEQAEPEAQSAEFGDVLARLDSLSTVPSDKAALPGLQQAAPGKQTAPAPDAAPVKAMPDPASLHTRDSAVQDVMPKELPVSGPVAAPVQQAALGLANAAHGVGASDKIAARVGSPGWDQQVGQKIVWMVAGKEQSATLTLNPPDMGPMQVVLSVTNDHASVTFSAATPEVRQALEDALPKLRDMMSESGIALGNASVNDGAAQQQARDDAPGRGVRGNVPGTVENTASGSAAEAEAKAAARPGRRGELPGLVDTFA
jgi:flagellar hook-length control protein FliK